MIGENMWDSRRRKGERENTDERRSKKCFVEKSLW